VLNLTNPSLIGACLRVVTIHPDPASLTPGEREITLLGRACPTPKSPELCTLRKTANIRVSTIMCKLGVNCRLQAATAAHSQNDSNSSTSTASGFSG